MVFQKKFKSNGDGHTTSCRRSLKKRYIRAIFLYTRPRLRPLSIHRSNKRKCSQIIKSKKQMISRKTIINANYANDLVLLANIPEQSKFLLHSLDQVAGAIGLCVNFK